MLGLLITVLLTYPVYALRVFPTRLVLRHRCRPLLSSISDTQSFADFPQLPRWLVNSCQSMRYTHPTLAQAKALPIIFSGVDVILQSQTGSGKTLAFALPILAKVDASRSSVQAVIVTPTRELGQQVAALLRQLARGAPQRIMVMSVMEGSKNKRQPMWAKADPPHIVVGNPKALQQLVDTGKLRLNAVSFVVVDEVDACLLLPTSKKELHRLLSRHLSNSYLDHRAEAEADNEDYLPPGCRHLAKKQYATDQHYFISRQTIMCSATIPQRRHFADAAQRNGWTERVPEIINLSDLHMLPECIAHEYVPCDLPLRPAILHYLLRKEMLSTADRSSDNQEQEQQEQKQCIVFVDQPSSAEGYRQTIQAAFSKHYGDNAQHVCVVVDDLHVEDRHAAMQAFRNGTCHVLLCSDLAARGIDIPSTSLVIQMSLPHTAMEYVHRAGRTGRLDRPGRVITLASDSEDFVLQRFRNELGIDFKRRELRVKGS